MATLLFLGASVSQLPAIRYARGAGHRVIAVDGDPNAIAFPLCDVAETVDFADVDHVTEVAVRHGAEAVLAISTDRAVPPAAAISARLGLAGIGVEVAQAMTDKALMRTRLAAGGIPQPGHVVLTAATNLDEACAKITFPAVLKPVDSGGQRGVFRIESVEQVRSLLPGTLVFSRSGRAMLEEYVDGVELNGILVARGGEPILVTLSDRLRPAGAGFGVGWIHSFPSSLPESVLADAEEVAVATVRALGLADGIAFPQLIADERGTVRVVEIAARIPAGQMADLVSFGTGINLFEVAIEQALGHEVPDALVTPDFTRPIAIRFLTASPGVLPLGTVSAIEGLDDVQAAPGVLAAGLYFGPGTTIGPVQVDADRRGYVIATAETPARALELADSASRKLVVRTTGEDRRFDHGLRRLLHGAGVLPIVVVLALLVAGASALVVTERGKLQPALVLGTRVTTTFSPVCGCSTAVAHVTFRLAQAGRVTVQIVNSAGRPVATFLRDRAVRPGWQHFVWNGLNRARHVLPNGSYFPQVSFPLLHRTLRLPSPITLDTRPPLLRRLAVRTTGSRIVVRYVFDGPAHAVLFVDGRRAVVTRRATARGRLIWDERFPDGPRVRLGHHRIWLIGIDTAGNRSHRSPVHAVGIKATRL
jgi:biotin carboxylase